MNASRDHRWAQPRVSAYIDGELDPRPERRLAAHERACPECAQLIRTLQTLLVILPSLRMPPEAGLVIVDRTADEVRARIAARD